MHPAVPRKKIATVICEYDGCGKEVEIALSHSIVMVYATTGVIGVPAQQCPAEQHFGCCQEHAIELAMACLKEHLVQLHTDASSQVQQ